MTDPILAGRIYVVDDQAANLRLLERFLGRAGFGDITSFTMTSYTPNAPWVPASVWQSTTTGTMRWTPTSVTLTRVVLTAAATSPTPAGAVTINGTWNVHGCAGS